MTTIYYLIVIFLAVFGVALAILLQLGERPVQKRLEGIGAENPELLPQQAAPVWVQRVVKLSGPLAKLALPKEGWENSMLRIRFMNAGYRFPSAPMLFFAAKTLLALALPGLLALYFSLATADKTKPALVLFLIFAATALGYLLPNAWLNWRIRNRQRDIFDNFPDALDLMTVCVEAGLALDAALARVGEEMRFKSATLAEELHLVNLEMRAGGGRERALRNLALRTGVAEIDSLVALLVQSDRFGTSVADSLRVHSDSLRTKRRLRAEEAAAKIPVKLLFPLIFCIFPALMLVLIGPSFITMTRVLFPALTGIQTSP
ncbi:MAG: type II secretion system F family protein [Nitrosomonadales bacterium]|nr:type II secretion system F family protein [Nitrosomonadales bacterium]